MDGHGRAAVTDFGLAVAAETPLDPAADVDRISLAATHAITRTGVLLGTPRYMSPEQFRGGAVDARSDQFSYAVALYEALYHQPPFTGATVGELRAAVTAGAVRARPAQTAVPLGVHRVVVRALAGDPAGRHASLDRLLDALEACVRPAHRRRAALSVVAGLAVAAAAAGALGLARRSPPAPPSPDEARAARPPGRAAPRTKVVVDRFANRTGDPRLDDTLDLVVADVLSRSTRLDPNAGVEIPLAGTTVDALVARLIADGRPALGLHGSVARDGAGYVVSLAAGGAQPGGFAATERAAGPDGVTAAAARLAARLLASLGDSARRARLGAVAVARRAARVQRGPAAGVRR